jgi:hypothetical protein
MESFDASVALNLIDMLDDPALLPKIQNQVLKQQGLMIQGSPYIWSAAAAKKLRKLGLTSKAGDSASAVEALYQHNGFELKKTERYVPWLFYKHLRQLEIYSVHLMMGMKA